MNASMPEKFYEEVKDLLPPDTPPGPQGGRPRVSNRIILAVWWFVLVAGVPWQDVPKGLGCSWGKAHPRLKEWQERGILKKVHARLLEVLRRAGKLALNVAVIDSFHVRAVGGGEATGPSPVDRRKKGSKHTVLVNQDGVPLVIHTAAANESDQTQILPTMSQFPEVRGQQGPPKQRPDELYADRGYDCEATRGILRWLGIRSKVAGPGRRTLQWPGPCPLGRRTHHKLAQRIAPAAHSIRSSAPDSAGLEQPGSRRHLFPSCRRAGHCLKRTVLSQPLMGCRVGWNAEYCNNIAQWTGARVVACGGIVLYDKYVGAPDFRPEDSPWLVFDKNVPGRGKKENVPIELPEPVRKVPWLW